MFNHGVRCPETAFLVRSITWVLFAEGVVVVGAKQTAFRKQQGQGERETGSDQTLLRNIYLVLEQWEEFGACLCRYLALRLTRLSECLQDREKGGCRFLLASDASVRGRGRRVRERPSHCDTEVFWRSADNTSTYVISHSMNQQLNNPICSQCVWLSVCFLSLSQSHAHSRQQVCCYIT